MSTKVAGMARSGRRATFERLVEDHLPAALRLALRLTGDPDRAEEVVQEAMLKASKAWRSFRGDAEFRTWLFRIVINAFRDTIQRRPSPVPLPDDLTDERQITASDAALANELGRMIAQRVSSLPPRQREVLVLATYEGLRPKRIAAVLGISETNVHATLYAARARLRRQLETYLAKEPNDPS